MEYLSSILVILLIALWIFYVFRRRKKLGSNCANCSKNCPSRQDPTKKQKL